MWRTWIWWAVGLSAGIGGILLWRNRAVAQLPAPAVSTKNLFVFAFPMSNERVAGFGEALAKDMADVNFTAVKCLPNGRFIGWQAQPLNDMSQTVEVTFEYDGPPVDSEAARQCFNQAM